LIAQSPIATTSRGSGIAATVRRSGSAMFRVTGPVTSATSACRGEATSRAPYRSASYTGLKAAAISISHPLQEPASTHLTCTEPPNSRACGRTSPPERGGAGSATRPAARILRSRPMNPP
jgi:hypothetical protein